MKRRLLLLAIFLLAGAGMSGPLWLGFAIYTIFYAAILWLLICGPFVLRWFIRARRGLCPKCVYPMGESPVCTECGAPLRKRTKVAT